ncbi:hypothetical protein SteCoe_37281 [Stentor coeruleus]|uniref:Rhoptry Protein kinase-like domain-containing protein n=1 Tax=Stentor coeruleus TaxID=5963 RepID=A0A1R2AND9_9CILI|nr:hypothetical protein SteCoe_37281 [Stentor coeruleus]
MRSGKSSLELCLKSGVFNDQKHTFKPYFIFSLGSQHAKSEDSSGQKPVWDWKYEFELGSESVILYKLFNKFTFKKDTQITEGSINISSLRCIIPVKIPTKIYIEKAYFGEFTIELVKKPVKLTPMDLIEDLFVDNLLYTENFCNEEVYIGSIPSSGDQAFIVMINFSSEESLTNYQVSFKYYQNLIDKGSLPLLKMHLTCSKMYFNFLYAIEKKGTQLNELISTRKITSEYWQESELIGYFMQMIDIFADYQMNNLSHGCICPYFFAVAEKIHLLHPGIRFKSLESFIKDSSDVMPEEKIPYFSPEMFGAWKSHQKKQKIIMFDMCRSDVFSLGLVFLHMASLNAPLGLNDDEKVLNGRIENEISRINYSENVKFVIKLMLNNMQNSRVTFVELQENFKQFSL